MENMEDEIENKNIMYQKERLKVLQAKLSSGAVEDYVIVKQEVVECSDSEESKPRICSPRASSPSRPTKKGLRIKSTPKPRASRSRSLGRSPDVECSDSEEWKPRKCSPRASRPSRPTRKRQRIKSTPKPRASSPRYLGLSPPAKRGGDKAQHRNNPPLKNAKISKGLFYGSEEDSDGADGDDEVWTPPLLVPRTARMYLYEHLNEMVVTNTELCFHWPPVVADHSEPATLVQQPALPTLESTPPASEPAPPALELAITSGELALSALESTPPTSKSTLSALKPASNAPQSVLNVSKTARPVQESIQPALDITSFFPRNKFDFEWRAFSQPQILPELRREPFSNISCGPTTTYATPYDAFIAIWDRQIMEHIVMETNRYSQQLTKVMLAEGTLSPNSRISNWRDTSVDELYVYFSVILATGIVVKTRLEEYWNNTRDIFSTPEFSRSMTIDRFFLLSKCLHFQNNDNCNPSMTRPQAKLFKVQPLVDHLSNKFSQLYNMKQNIALDESLTLWKGWSDINNKPVAAGIKTYEICESQTGYLWRFEVHAGHDDTSSPREDSPISERIPALVLKLLRGLEYRGHTIWMDNSYNSPALARELKIRGFDCVGTLRTNCRFVPKELANLEKCQIARGQVIGCTSGDVDLLVWRDKNRVAFISTYHGLAIVNCDNIYKPTAIQDYNVCMGGIDRRDQMIAMYPIERTKIWYKKFFRSLLNTSVFNAYILFKSRHQISHRSFRKTLVKQLLSHHFQPLTTPTNPAATGHFPKQYDFIPGRDDRRRRKCVVCQKRTNTYCNGCNVTLCVFTCFGPHHNHIQMPH